MNNLSSEECLSASSLLQQIEALQAEVTRLREQNRFLLAAVNEMTSGMVVTDARFDQPIIFVNRAFSDITGYTPAEALGRNCRFLQGPQTDRATVARLREAIAAERPIQARLLNYRKDGQPFWNQLAINPVHDDTGQVVAFVGLQTDITAQMAVEQALAEREQLLRAVGRMAGVGGWELDLATRQMVWSEEMFVIHELPVGEPPPPEVALWFYPAEVHHIIDRAFRRCVESGEPWDLELPFRTARGNLRWVRSLGQPVWEDGHIVKIRGTFQDITRNKESELALRASEQRYRMLANLLPGSIVLMFDADLRLTLVAGAELARFNVDAAALEGQYLSDVLPEPHRAKILPLCREALNGVPRQIDYVFDGEVFDTTILPVEITPGQVSGGLIIGRNITAERRIAADLLRAKEAAEQAERARSAFLSAISHELRTPLNAVIASAELLLTDHLPDAQRMLAEMIRAGGESLLAIVNNVLDLSQMEANRLEITIEPVDVRALIDAVVALFRRDAMHKGLSLDVIIEPDLPKQVLTDGARLRQIVINLASNAVKFTDRGSVVIKVAISAAADERSELQITVRDTGIGIPAAQLPRIFQPMTQLERDQARRGGAGLGLAVSLQLAQMMGGSLSVESRVGEGSTFTLKLPVQIVTTAHPAPEAVVEPVASLPPARELRVLVAEDNEINQQVAFQLLRVLKCQVTVVPNGLEAVQAVQRQPFDVVLMDIQMPEMDGEEATRRIRALGDQIRQPRIIALTAYAMAGMRERCLNAGMDDFLNKPVRLQDLREALQKPVRSPAAPPLAGATVDDQVIDWNVFGELLSALGAGQTDVAMKTRELIRREFQQQLDQLSEAIRNHDPAQVRHIAHRLKGGARQVGAVRVAAAAQSLEQAAAAQMPLESLLNNLQYAVSETIRLLEIG
ncbi:PAS domain-containing protein [Chloroflexus sp.]|uniref:PAS domain-containing protein n=1 Tax=Chloroflexus sp. TaxID=1904827 RepID=UPI0026206E0A|nr:PAS domain-containing protein [uncultured Chloroflexus sp.]